MNYEHRIEQKIVDENAIANGDFVLDIGNKTVDVLVECDDNSGYNAIVGWNEAPNKDVLIPGKGKAYGVPERGFIDGNKLHVNFSESGSGAKRALITIWKQGKEVC